MYRQMIQSLRMVFVAPVRLHWVQFAALGLSALSTGMGFMGSKKAERKAKQERERQAMLQTQQAKLQKEGIAASQEEARHKMGTDLHDTTVAFMQQRASIVAGAGEGGVAGGSVVRSLVDRTRGEQDLRGRSMYALEVFNEKSLRDIHAADLGFAGAQSRYEGVSTSSLAISAGLNFASDFLRIGTNDKGQWTGFK